MMKHSLFFISHVNAALFCLIFFSCQKGEPIALQEYMKLNIETFYDEPSLYSSISFNGEELMRDVAGKDGGDIINMLLPSVEMPMPPGDSGRLQITIIKQNPPNLIFDEIIHVNHFNDFLFLQLDPLEPPIFINKNSVSAPERPTGDSIKARFYFSSNDPHIRNHNYSPATKVTKMDLEIWKIEIVDGIRTPVNTGVKIRIYANQLTDQYFSFAKGGEYAWRLLDVSENVASNKRVIENFVYDADFYEAFTRGFIELRDNNVFQTIKITQTFDAVYSYEYGINGKYLFGFN